MIKEVKLHHTIIGEKRGKKERKKGSNKEKK